MDALETIYWTGNIAEAALAAVCAALSFRYAGKRKETSLVFYMLAGFYACVFMSDLFYLLTWIVEDYPFVFSPGDISWVGGILFLITSAMSQSQKWTAEQRQAARRYRLPALSAPAVCAVFYAAYSIIYPEILINYLLYGIPTVILSYYSLWFFLASCKGGVNPVVRLYHLAVQMWIANQLFYDLFSTLGWDYGFAVYETIFSCLLVITTTGIYIAARKGAAK